MSKRTANIKVLQMIKEGQISRAEASILFSLKGTFKPNLSRQDKPYKAVCILFDTQPRLIDFFEIDLSELTDSELRQILKLQQSERARI